MAASHHLFPARRFNNVSRKRALARSVIEPLESRLCLNVALPGVQASAGDYNGDGKIDLLVTAVGRHQGLSVRLGNGDGTFGVATEVAGRGFGRNGEFGVGDLNNDGHPDVVIGVASTPGNAGGVYLLLNHGNGTFAAPVRLGGSAFATTGGEIAIGDWNGDGNYDVYVDTRTTIRQQHRTRRIGNVFLMLGNGDGTFAAPTVVA